MTHHPLYVGKRMSNERGYRISLSMKRTKQAKELFRGKPYFNLKRGWCGITLIVLQLKERLVWYHTNCSST